MEDEFEGQTSEVNVNFKKWLESMALMTPSTDKGGFDNTPPEEDDGGDGGDGWDWDRMELYRWHLLKWCRETASMGEIAGLFGNFVERQSPKKVTYRVLHSQYKIEGHPRYVLQLDYEFDLNISPVEEKLRKILEKSDLHKALGKEKRDNWTLLQEEEVREYMAYIICSYLTRNNDSSKDAWARAAEGSLLGNHFSFNVWNRLKKTWASKVLPKISEIAILAVSKGDIERPKSWMEIGNPEVNSDISKVRPPWSSTVYDYETQNLLATVNVMVPFDWNIKS